MSEEVLGKLFAENCQLFESFYRFQITSIYHEKSIFFLASQSAQLYSFFIIICGLILYLKVIFESHLSLVEVEDLVESYVGKSP